MSDGLAGRIARVAVRSLLREAEAGPKPGLVDRFGPGAHADMDVSHFRQSAAALGPYFRRMAEVAAAAAEAGRTARPDSSRELAAALRGLGVEAEAAMLKATGGVNTHKGAVWTLGLLCAAAGSLGAARYEARAADARDGARRRVSAAASPGIERHGARAGAPTAEELCDEAAALARAVIGLAPATGGRPGPERGAEARAETHGQAARRAYGLRSARDEAAAGFPAIRTRALPLARKLRDGGTPEDELVISVLLGAMADCDDTCLVARGGMESLVRARYLAERILDAGGPCSPTGAALYAAMIAEFSGGRLSPGGSADLCAAALFLADAEAPAVAAEEAARPDRREHRACLALA